MTPEELEKLRKALAEQVSEGLKSTSDAVDEIKTAMEALKKDVEEQAKKNKISVPGVETDKFSFAECLRTVKNGKALLEMQNYEGEVLRETMKAQTVEPISAGGVFVPTEVSARIVDLALARTVLNTLNIQRINVEGNNRLSIPTVVSDPSAAWFGELEDIDESSMVFGAKLIEPWKLAAYVAMSNEILTQRSARIDNIVERSMGRQLALALDFAGLAGTGQGDNMPLGILNTPDINIVDQGETNGDPATWETYDLLQAVMETANTLEGELAYISRPEVHRKLKNQTIANYTGQTDGMPLFGVPFMSHAQLEGMVGMPIRGTTQLEIEEKGTNDTAPLIFGDFSQLLLATYGNLELASDTSVLFKKYGTVMRAVMRADIKVLREKSFAVAPTVAFRATPD